MLDTSDSKKSYPLDPAEVISLLNALPAKDRDPVQFALNTGCREQEICSLRWEWERVVDGVQCFVLPGAHTKNGESRVVVLNRVLTDIITQWRGRHPTLVFAGLKRLNTPRYQKAWKMAQLPTEGVTHGVHNLRHTFGRNLRALRVPHETRQVLLGHANGSITTHYSPAELVELQEAVELLPTLRPGTLLRAVA